MVDRATIAHFIKREEECSKLDKAACCMHPTAFFGDARQQCDPLVARHYRGDRA